MNILNFFKYWLRALSLNRKQSRFRVIWSWLRLESLNRVRNPLDLKDSIPEDAVREFNEKKIRREEVVSLFSSRKNIIGWGDFDCSSKRRPKRCWWNPNRLLFRVTLLIHANSRNIAINARQNRGMQHFFLRISLSVSRYPSQLQLRIQRR